ncbi:PREDICTED: DNA mismatch repair protein MLH1-like isoform X2 [Lupinus angustifolius]|uniref:DNA mismatch repair protein MLH1-like isoform X2 n=1 Tax=Lupinus angustifolius TaxID=3871 RepID=UPI00092F9B33|nr:PREDICTED: DNA mismatch repair protein MLH1-like isoform X2 [Lupinus angustifolius]
MNMELGNHNSGECPPKIHRLSHSVVKRITAGDVIQHPLSAVKELIENSLDAHSTNINVIIQDGGFKLIQVNDNGHGVRYEDLAIMCGRHTTSKLLKFEELMRLKTMGFRGEALSSISHLGDVTVTTITQGSVHGYRVSYKDGAMEHEPKPCAAVKGTQVTVENLFCNMAASKKALQNSHGDYKKIVDLVSRFALHHTNVSFSCRKHKATRPDVHTNVRSSRLDVIRSVYGIVVAGSLMEIEVADSNPSTSVFEMHGFMSNATYAAKKTTMILFINDRLVEWSALKRAIEVVYTKKLHKASKPFVYISIVLPPGQIDVNMHATKKEVSILNQGAMIEQIMSMVESRLRSSNEAQSFDEQTARQSSPSQINTSMKANLNSKAMESRSKKVPVHKLVRTDSLDLAGRLQACGQTKFDGHTEKGACSNAVRSSVSPSRNPKTAADLTSVQALLAVINNDCDPAMMDIVRHCSYIGMTDNVFVVLQHHTHLYLANIVNLSKELMYQQFLSQFAHHKAISISDPLPLKDLILLALKEDDIDLEVKDDDNLKEKIAEMKSKLLKEKAQMLDEFFGINIDEHGNISGLPLILDKHTPNMDHIHEFALCLGNDVDWKDEKNCIQGISVALGNLYAMHPPMFPNPFGDGLFNYKKVNQLERGTFDITGVDAINNKVEHGMPSQPKNEWTEYEWKIQHFVFPSFRDFLKPSVSMATNGTFVKVTSLERLNKLLGRC